MCFICVIDILCLLVDLHLLSLNCTLDPPVQYGTMVYKCIWSYLAIRYVNNIHNALVTWLVLWFSSKYIHNNVHYCNSNKCILITISCMYTLTHTYIHAFDVLVWLLFGWYIDIFGVFTCYQAPYDICLWRI